MTVSLSRHTHISNYKKALVSIFDKKKTWNYLKEQRKIALEKKALKKREKELPKVNEVIYH